MCGRFSRYSDIAEAFTGELFERELIEASYNIAPSSPVAVIRENQQSGLSEKPYELTTLKWGLVPFWADDASIGQKMINARSETAHEKPSFRQALQKRRCLIPADGFFEWQKLSEKKKSPKQPWFITAENNEMLWLAGLWEVNKKLNNLQTCTILTKPADDLMKPVHHRMPVILSKEKIKAWLSSQNNMAFESFFTDGVHPPLKRHEVSNLVNRPENNGPDCISPDTLF